MKLYNCANTYLLKKAPFAPEQKLVVLLLLLLLRSLLAASNSYVLRLPASFELRTSNFRTCVFLYSLYFCLRFSRGFICIFSLSRSLSIILQTSKFRIQLSSNAKYFDMESYLKRESYYDPISFEVQQNNM